MIVMLFQPSDPCHVTTSSTSNVEDGLPLRRAVGSGVCKPEVLENYSPLEGFQGKSGLLEGGRATLGML